MDVKGQARHVSNNTPAYSWSAQVHRTLGILDDGFNDFIRFFSFNTCASFPKFFIFGLKNLFKLKDLPETGKKHLTSLNIRQFGKMR